MKGDTWEECLKRLKLFIFDLYAEFEYIREKMNEWDKRPNLKKLREWWDNMDVNFTLTSVGSVLAHSNLQRCESKVPNLKA